jgi:hypothetical protein
MRTKHFILIIALLFLATLVSGCVQKPLLGSDVKLTSPKEPEAGKPILGNKGIVYGHIGIYQGNCMPGPGRGMCSPRDIQTNIYITKPSQKYEEELLVNLVTTDEKGYFETELTPGDYSLFIDDNGAYICDYWKGVVCTPFRIESGERTEVNANIDHAAW